MSINPVMFKNNKDNTLGVMFTKNSFPLEI